MVAEISKPIAIFPDLPREIPAIDKDGNFTSLWSLGLSSLFQALQQNFKNEGIVFPPLSAANMTTIQNLYTAYIGGTYQALTKALPDISGQTVFDSTTYITNQFVIAKDNSTDPLVTLAEWVPLAVMLTSSGTPDLTVAGVLNWLCYDTVGKVLYVCYVAGAAGTARWSAL